MKILVINEEMSDEQFAIVSMLENFCTENGNENVVSTVMDILDDISNLLHDQESDKTMSYDDNGSTLVISVNYDVNRRGRDDSHLFVVMEYDDRRTELNNEEMVYLIDIMMNDNCD